MVSLINTIQNHKIVMQLAAGLSGSLVGLAMHPKINNFHAKATFVFAGTLSAIFLTGLVARKMGMFEIEELMGVGFVIAAFWSAILNKIKSWLFPTESEVK